MKTITVLSGKGGVGKTSIAASLAVMLSKDYEIVAADCDVDAPNLNLVLGAGEFDKLEEVSTNEKAFLDPEKCTSCGKCKDICAFSAIEWDEEKDMPSINKYLCEGCGACALVCPEDAFELRKVNNAAIGEVETQYGFTLISGQLKMGESGSGRIVDEVKEKVRKKNPELAIVDSAAGIGCPVIASVRGSDFVIGVTEPTPAGLSDLKRAFGVVDFFGVQRGIIVNKWDLNKDFTKKIGKYASENGIPILGKLRYDKKFVEALVNLEPIVTYDEGYQKVFSEMIENIPIL